MVLAAAVHVLFVDVFLRPAHVDGGVDVDLADHRAGGGADGEEEAEETLPAGAAGEAVVVIAPEVQRCFRVDLGAGS